MNKLKHNLNALSPAWLRAMCFTLLTVLSLGVQAQTITTTFANNNGSSVTVFSISNNSATAPYLLTGIGSVAGFTGTGTARLYAKPATFGVAPGAAGAITAANGWTNIGSNLSLATTANTTTNVATTWITGMSYTIPPLSQIRFCIQHVSVANAASFSTTAGSLRYSTVGVQTCSFASGNLTLNACANYAYGGTMASPTNTPRGFIGFVTYQPLTPCSGTPAPGSTTTTGPSNICSGTAFTLGLSSLSSPGLTYVWESANDNTFTTGLATETSTTSTQVITSQVATRAYRCNVTCTNGGASAYSTPITITSDAPTPGATISSVAGACVGAAFNLTLANPQATSGYTYQWQSASDMAFTTPTNLGTASTQTIATQSVATYYRCTVSCAGLALSTTSTPVLVTQNAPTACYCTPVTTLGCTDGDVIARVVLNTLDNNSGTGCPSGTLGYSNYTTNPALTTTLQAGGTYACVVSAGQYSESYAAWIDYNDDGLFANPAERIGFTATPVAGSGLVGVLGSSAAFPITLSCSPPVGVHRLRVRAMFNIAGSAVTPCGNNTYGEVEDYLITVSQADPCPAPSAMTATATGGGANLAWTQGCVETDVDIHVTTVGGGAPTGTPSNPGVIPALPAAPTYSVTGLDPTTAYEVWYRADCDPSTGGGQSGWVGPVLFTTLATCFPPTALVASNITSSDAEVNFTAPVSGTPAGYQYYVSTSATAPTGATLGTAITGPGATQTTLGNALTPNTLHYVWVRSNCGTMPISGNPNNSAWSVSTTFTTLNVPCAGTPNPGNVLPSSACPGSTVVLSLQNATIGTGVTYQWFDGGGSPIAGATNATYTTPAIVGGEQFYCEVTCANGPATGTSNTGTISLTPFNQCYCSSMPSTTADEEIFGVSMTSTTATTAQTSNCTTLAPGAGSIVARYSNYTGNTPLSAQQGTVVNFTIDLNACGTGTFSNGTAIFIDLNQNGSYADAGEKVFVEPVLVPTAPGVGRVLTGSFSIPYASTVGTTGMRIMNVESSAGAAITPCMSYFYGETEDYLITIDPGTGCNGTPTPGNVVASANPVCPGSIVTLSLQNAIFGSGVTYQWFDGGGSPIAGATNATYTTPAIAGGEQYYCEATCSNGPVTGTSSTLTMTLSPFNQCYCTSLASTTFDEEIFGVSMTSTSGTVSQLSTCATTGGAGSLLNQYSNYTGNTPLAAPASTSVSFTIDLNACGTGTYNNHTAIFIDLNQNGSYADAGEMVYDENASLPTPPGTGRILTGTFSIPVTATLGVTGMRVMNVEQFTLAPITPCMFYSYGETEDYLIDITAPPACAGTPTPGNTLASATTVCAGNTVALSLQTQTTGSGVTYQWYDGAGAIAGANSNAYTATVTASTSYYCEVTCSGNTGTSTSVAVTANPIPVGSSISNPIVVGQAPCVGSPYTNTQTNTTANCFTDNQPSNFGSSPDVWYQFTLAAPATVNVGLCGSSFDTYVSILDNLGNVLFGNDDNGPLCVGSESSITAALAAGTYYVVSQGYNTNTGALLTTINTTNSCAQVVNLTCFIEGYVDGALSPVVEMRPVALNQFVPGATATDCDVITVELHDATTPFALSTPAVTANLNVSGQATATFAAVPTGSYYVVVKHRTIITTWSANPIAITAGSPASYNFSSGAGQAFGSNMVDVNASGSFAFFSGDIDGGLGAGSVETEDYTLWQVDSDNFGSGYIATDLNGDGSAESNDYSIWEANSNNFVGIVAP